MSDTEERKSMDDVLASIRRIVRAEKQPEPDIASAEDVERPTSAPEGDSPLALTPDMMMGKAATAIQDAATDTSPMERVPDPDPATSGIGSGPSVPETPAEAAALAVGGMGLTEPKNPAQADLDPDELRDMVRAVVMEELAGEGAGDLIRSVLREELVNGQIGANISQNVMSLIQSEVGKALKG